MKNKVVMLTGALVKKQRHSAAINQEMSELAAEIERVLAQDYYVYAVCGSANVSLQGKTFQIEYIISKAVRPSAKAVRPFGSSSMCKGSSSICKVSSPIRPFHPSIRPSTRPVHSPRIAFLCT